MKQFIYPAFFLLFLSASVFAGDYQVTSPDKRIELTIGVNDNIKYYLSVDGKKTILPSVISMTLEKFGSLCDNAEVVKTGTASINEKLTPVVPVKRSTVVNNYNELKINFKNNYSLLFRAYNDGIAYRFVTDIAEEIKILDEGVNFNLPADYNVYFPEEESFQTHQERLYKHIPISGIGEKKFSSLPAIVEIPGGVKIAITEADLFDYPGIYLSAGAGPFQMKAIFPNYPLKTELKSDRDEVVTERAGYLAATKGKRDFPWRVLAISRDDKELLENDIVFRLARENQIGDTKWIKPGKVAWDWWNANNIYGVDFKSGINTATYKYYIDFAAKYGLEYIILDEGWYKLGNLLEVSKDIDMAGLTSYAKKKNVGIILWCVWKTLDDQLEAAMNQFEKWGIKGIKVDFMQREDQWMMNYYERIAREAAKRKLLVDFHGAGKPTGLYKTYPNVLTSEGVKGLENAKWGTQASPDNAVTFPFMRMLAGPADYTPGAMMNASKENFQPIWERPMSLGTRCQQIAMYVLYESPLQMLADAPSNYLKEPECTQFISKVPVIWDDTKALDAKIGDHILVAKRSKNDWYVGAMTNQSAKDLTIDFSFLGKGNYKIEIFQDGINADRCGIDYKRTVTKVTDKTKMAIHLAPGGGWAARITK